MKGTSLKIAPNMWKKLMILGQQQGSIRLTDLAREMGLAEVEALSFLREIFPGGVGAEIYQQGDECWVDINAEAMQYMLPLTPAEWMELHRILSESVATTAIQQSLRHKLVDSGPIKVIMELLNELGDWTDDLTGVKEEVVSLLDKSVVEKTLIHFTTRDEKTLLAFPCRIVHLEGELSLIAEDSKDHCLIVIPVKDIVEANVHSREKQPRVSPFEIEEFISAIRSMSDKETRLILKIHDPQSVNLFPDYHFLGKPCMITNPNGDLIWAAYVEACDPLFDWLYSLGSNVEILDPVNFKQEFLSYCEEKVRKIA